VDFNDAIDDAMAEARKHPDRLIPDIELAETGSAIESAREAIREVKSTTSAIENEKLGVLAAADQEYQRAGHQIKILSDIQISLNLKIDAEGIAEGIGEIVQAVEKARNYLREKHLPERLLNAANTAWQTTKRFARVTKERFQAIYDTWPTRLKNNNGQKNRANSDLEVVQLPYTYWGLLDDVLVQYDERYASEYNLRKMIVKQLFFGGQVFLNDGYLVKNRVLHKYLSDENSILYMMIVTNFVRVLTRSHSADALICMPYTMAKSGNVSFQRVIASEEWKTFEPTFKKISSLVFWNGNVRTWPKYDMSIGYKKLSERIFNKEPKELGLNSVTADHLKRIRDKYFQSDPGSGNARHKLEMASLEILKQSESDVNGSMREIMNIANQAYHYNFGLMLTAEEENVVVDTTPGNAFDDLLQSRSVKYVQIKNIPLIQVPENVSFYQGDLFRPFTDPTSRVSEAKIEFLSALSRFLSESSGDIESLRVQVTEISNKYIDRIKEVFQEDLRSPQIKANPQLAAMVQTRTSAAEWFRLNNPTKSFNRPEDKFVTVGDILPIITTFVNHRQKSMEFIENIPILNS
jgi:hypothetical protein